LGYDQVFSQGRKKERKGKGGPKCHVRVIFERGGGEERSASEKGGERESFSSSALAMRVGKKKNPLPLTSSGSGGGRKKDGVRCKEEERRKRACRCAPSFLFHFLAKGGEYEARKKGKREKKG